MSTLSLIGILIITIVLIYLSIKIIKSSNSEEKFTEMQTYWFVFIFFIFGGIILILSLVGFSSAMILLNNFLDISGWILIFNFNYFFKMMSYTYFANLSKIT